MSYSVKVSKAGTHVRTLFVPMAQDALDACNQIEANLGLKLPYGTVCPETGKIGHIGWHGFMFVARAIET